MRHGLAQGMNVYAITQTFNECLRICDMFTQMRNTFQTELELLENNTSYVDLIDSNFKPSPGYAGVSLNLAKTELNAS